MFQKTRESRRWFGIVAIAVVTALPGVALSAADVATAAIGDALLLRPALPTGALELRVTGPEGLVGERQFAAGAAVEISLLRGDGSNLPDGAYNWELRTVAPAQRTRGEAEAGGDLVQDAAGAFASGSFRIVQGAVLAGDGEVESENAAGGRVLRPAAPTVTPLDQVIPDDLIVQQSLCVGFDCVNGESFGFDTIRLKENNTRIKFQDTSVGTFPSNDWQLTANDSASGGQNKFSIEDITGARVPMTVEAGATTNSIYVDSTGRVGFRTSTPVLDLHINTSNTPGIRLEQNSSGGFTAQTWDVAGNEANFFVRDVTGGSRLSFRIRPGAPTSSLDINPDGDIGVGTGSPNAPVHVSRNGSDSNAGFLLENTGGTVPSLWFFQVQSTNGAFVATPNAGGTNAPFKVFTGAPENSLTIGQNGGGTSPRVGVHRVSSVQHPLHVGTDATNGNGAHVTAAGVWTNGSSRTNKTDIVELSESDAVAALAELHPVRYKGTQDESGEEYLGFIAEDVPSLVAMNDRKGLAAMDFVALLTQVVKRQQSLIDELAGRLTALEAEKAAAKP